MNDYDETQKNASYYLSRISEFIEPTEDELLQMPIEEVRKELEDEGINVDKEIKEVKAQITTIQAKEKLSQARNRRISLMEVFKDFVVSAKKFDRQEIIKKIKDNFGFNEKDAMVYCRKFEESKDGDLESLLTDLELLENIKNERSS